MDLTPFPKIRILLALLDGPMTKSEICRMLGMTRSPCMKLLMQMQDDEHLVVGRDVVLTENGLAWAKYNDQVLKPWPDMQMRVVGKNSEGNIVYYNEEIDISATVVGGDSFFFAFAQRGSITCTGELKEEDWAMGDSLDEAVALILDPRARLWQEVAYRVSGWVDIDGHKDDEPVMVVATENYGLPLMAQDIRVLPLGPPDGRLVIWSGRPSEFFAMEGRRLDMPQQLIEQAEEE